VAISDYKEQDAGFVNLSVKELLRRDELGIRDDVGSAAVSL